MNIIDARDTMLGHATAAAPAGIPITYQDVPLPEISGANIWIRATVKHVDAGQKGFGDNKRKYVSIGILCVEVFAIPGDGLTDGDIVAQTIKTNLENVRSSPIWYRNIRAVDVGGDGGYTKINVYADFEYEDHH